MGTVFNWGCPVLCAVLWGWPLDAVDLAIDQLKRQCAGLQVLRAGQHAAGHKALGDQLVLESVNDQLDAFGADATPHRVVWRAVSKCLRRIDHALWISIEACVKGDALNDEAGTFIGRQQRLW